MLLRPLVRGATGAWVRAGASWRELEHGWAVYGRPAPLPAHREAMLALHEVYQSLGRGRYLAADRPVHLDEVGPRVWRLLAGLQDVGVTLLADGDAPVRLAPEPARAVVDVVLEKGARGAAARRRA